MSGSGGEGGGPPTYPIHLKLDGCPVLVVGAGTVGRRKIEGLLSVGARLDVVAPEAVAEVRDLAAAGRLTWHRRPYRPGEARGYTLVFVATGVREVDEQVADDARASGIPINVADVPDLCTFYLPAVVRRGPLALTAITDGSAPFVSKRIRRRLETQWPAETAAWIEAAGAFRRQVLRTIPVPAVREALFDRFVSETLPAEGKDASERGTGPRVPAEAEWRGWIAAAAADLDRCD